MPCYVDPLFDTRGWSDNWPYPFACHLMADSDEELHALAGQLGLKRAWWQTRPPHSVSHYDLTVRKRARAIELGAIEVTRGFFPQRERQRSPSVCHVCGLGPAVGVTVYRQNETGIPGVWACRAHSTVPLDPETQDLIDAIEKG